MTEESGAHSRCQGDSKGEIYRRAQAIIELITKAKTDDYAKGVKDGIEGMLKEVAEAKRSFPHDYDYLRTSNVGSLDEIQLILDMYKWKAKWLGNDEGAHFMAETAYHPVDMRRAMGERRDEV